MVLVKNLSFSYTDKPLYKDVSFMIAKGKKVGLVGPNGSGKSTLLKILMEKEDGFSGKVEVSGKLALVPQEVKHDAEMEAAQSVLHYVDPKAEHEKHEIQKLFAGIELKIKLTDDPTKLSGGQKTKLALAKALLAAPDVLLLDEPTNFMDIAGKHWVMNFLGNYEGTVIVISHDLELMDKRIDKVLAVNPATSTIEEYSGTYSDYVRLKKEKEEMLKRQLLIKQKHIKQMEEGLKKMARYTSKKGVRARIRVKRRVEKEKEALPDAPAEIRKIKINLPEPASVGELPIRAINVSKNYGNLEVLKNVNFTIVRNERIVLLGPNGVGKSTFIKILMGMIEPDSGEIVKNSQLKVGYYSQEFETFDFSKKLIDVFMEITKKDERYSRAFLGRYMFAGDKVFQRIETLSGGEKTRLSIAILTAQDNNLLILDEPTTYLDVMSQRIILESLKEYKGTMILVSHTPEFVVEMGPTKAFLFPEEKFVYWDDSLVGRVEEI